MDNLDSVLPLTPIAPVNNIKHVQNVTFVYFSNKAYFSYWYTHYMNIDGQTHLVDFFYPHDLIEPAMDRNNAFNRQFNTLLQTTEYKELHFEKAIVLHIYTKAPSHEFAQIINLIYIYKTFNLQDYDIVVNIDIKNLGNSISSILEVFIDPNKIHYVDHDNKVFIKTGIIYNSTSSRENIHVNYLVNELKHFRVNKNQYEKICFIKNNGSKNLYSNIRMFDESYINYFSSKGYVFIDPAGYHVIDLFNLIQDAKNVIFTWGSNSWVNSSYCNEQNNVMILCHIGYEHEYSTSFPCWTPVICNRLVKVTGLTSDPINNEVYKLFDKKLVELEEGIVE